MKTIDIARCYSSWPSRLILCEELSESPSRMSNRELDSLSHSANYSVHGVQSSLQLLLQAPRSGSYAALSNGPTLVHLLRSGILGAPLLFLVRDWHGCTRLLLCLHRRLLLLLLL